MTTPEDTIRRRAMEGMRAGLLLPAEAAEYLGTSRQAVRQLALRAGFDPVLARHRYLARLFDLTKKPLTTT